MQVTNKYAIENNIAIEEIFQIAISQYTKNADKLAIEEEISNFLFFDTFFTNRFTGNFSSSEPSVRVRLILGHWNFKPIIDKIKTSVTDKHVRQTLFGK